ncbi:MAG: hypothetical protein BECKG1743D_GA0114223_100242 [Candidatus Kentron sp. G]|nr:MAG: hypothetical protein BECKG1743F_GA0114225_101081 [Candidatus Kentron sp. G]VFM97079.1 MAG: hypothetical protein BECKG1743E_GA0114224_101111 [Candidatus Kentron sp. G]VFM97669.1 MAG: hypothetical protein BECKG1743D_GA0114223_100242 [Candidatus Kentron sp. G]
MLEDDIFGQWLDTEAERVLIRLKNNEPITQDDKLIIVIKGQTNHIRHLDVDLRQEMIALRQDMDRRFEQVDKRIEQVDKRFEQIDKRFESNNEEIKQLYRAINAQTWKMISAVGLIVLLGKLIERF